MSDSQAKLISLAESVADGSVVDWKSAEASASDDERELLKHLRAVEEISKFHRERSRSPEVRPALTATAEHVPVASSSSPALERWGPLKIVRKLGEGAFGEVYQAWDPKLEREVALKLLRPQKGPAGGDVDAAVLQEGRNMARVRHPNVIMVFGADRFEERVGLWMELVRGRTLAMIVREEGVLDALDAARVGVDVSRALAAVHSAGLVHRDVKAQNVMREPDGRTLLMDFGAGSDTRGLSSGSGSRALGTPYYMAPELLRGVEPSVQSDVYSVGVLLYYLVTGKFPVEGANLAELRTAHAKGEVKPLRDVRPDLSAEFVRVVEKALAPTPGDRYASATQLDRALEEVLEAPRRRRRKIFLGIAVGMVLAAVAGWAAWRALDPSYEIETSLVRIRPGESELPLRPGDPVRVGDGVQMKIRASKDVFVYVVNEDEKGAVFVLFPLPGGELQNPLKASTETHSLPSAGTSWEVTSGGGREYFTVIASPERNAAIEEKLASIPRAQFGAPMELTDEQKQGLGEMAMKTRGAGRVVTKPKTDGTRARLFDDIPAPRSEVERVKGEWIRQIELVNTSK